MQLIPEMGKGPGSRFKELIDGRNSYVHSAAPKFQAPNDWEAHAYKILRVLLKYQGGSLGDVLSDTEVKVAEKTVKAFEDGVMKIALDLKAVAKKNYRSMSPVARKAKKMEVKKMQILAPRGRAMKRVPCPACEARAFLGGEEIRRYPPTQVDGEFTEKTVYLPVHFRCYVCQLKVKGHDLLHHLRLGEPFSVWRAFDMTSLLADEPDNDHE